MSYDIYEIPYDVSKYHITWHTIFYHADIVISESWTVYTIDLVHLSTYREIYWTINNGIYRGQCFLFTWNFSRIRNIILYVDCTTQINNRYKNIVTIREFNLSWPAQLVPLLMNLRDNNLLKFYVHTDPSLPNCNSNFT